MKKRLPEILCMAAVLVGLLALAAQARAEQTHRAYLYGYPDGTIRPEAEVSRAAFACILLRLAENELPEGRACALLGCTGDELAYAAVTRLAGLGLLPFGSDGCSGRTRGSRGGTFPACWTSSRRRRPGARPSRCWPRPGARRRWPPPRRTRPRQRLSLPGRSWPGRSTVCSAAAGRAGRAAAGCRLVPRQPGPDRLVLRGPHRSLRRPHLQVFAAGRAVDTMRVRQHRTMRLRASADIFRRSCGAASKSLPFRAGFFSACSRFIQAKCVPVWHNILFRKQKK